MRRNGLQHYHRERPPWKPERGQRVRIIGRLSISEPVGFTLAMTFAALCVALLIAAVLVF
jgi:hypothetical protein